MTDQPAPKCVNIMPSGKPCGKPMWHLNNWDAKRTEDIWICSGFPHHRLKIKRVGEKAT